MKEVIYYRNTGKIHSTINRAAHMFPSRLSPDQDKTGLAITRIPEENHFDPFSEYIYVKDDVYISSSRKSLPHSMSTSTFFKPRVLPPFDYKPIMPEKGQIRAIIVRFRGIGDVIMTLPAIEILYKTYPQWHITYITKYAHLLQRFSFIHNVIEMDYMHPNAGYPELPIGLPIADTTYNLINKVDFGKIVQQRARADNFAYLLGVKIPKNHKTPVFPLTNEEILWTRDTAFGNGFMEDDIKVACQLDSFGDCRFWHLERWYELADAMPKAKFVWFSVKEEHRWLKVPGNVINTACQLTLPECLSLISACSIIVCPDSSFMHLGAILRIPVIILSGSTQVKFHTKYHPHQYPIWAKPKLSCSPCYDWQLRNDCFHDKAGLPWCLTNIKAKEVAVKIQQILKLINNQHRKETTYGSK